MGIRVNASRCTSSRLIFAVGAVRMHRFCRSRIYRSLRSLKERNMDHRFSRHWPGKLDEQADKTGREAIEEARMVLPGIQALFGFQLIAIFNERFKELTEDEQLIHFSAEAMELAPPQFG
jgi:hypothetical protein